MLREFSIATKEFRGDENGHVKELVTINLEWFKDDKGQFKSREIAGTEKGLADAIGPLGDGFVGPGQEGPDQRFEFGSRSAAM